MRELNGTAWAVAMDDASVTAVYEPGPAGAPVFVFAHGAGGSMSDRAVLAASKALRGVGIGTVRFNFLYKERGSGRPDPMPRLEACIRAVVQRTRDELSPRTLLIGGRSMGGRAASMLAAKQFTADGLLLLAYPLHPPGQQDKLRDAHLPDITMPVLCFNGTRDTFCDRALMERATSGLPWWTMHWLEGADHSFHVLKSSGRTDAQVLDEVAVTAREWMAGLT